MQAHQIRKIRFILEDDFSIRPIITRDRDIYLPGHTVNIHRLPKVVLSDTLKMSVIFNCIRGKFYISVWNEPTFDDPTIDNSTFDDLNVEFDSFLEAEACLRRLMIHDKRSQMNDLVECVYILNSMY